VPALLAVVVALVAGLFLLGRVSDKATVSMGLTALWFGLVFVVAAALALRIRILLWPLAIGYTLVAVAAGVLVIAPTLIDKKVDEQIVTGAPASPPPAPWKADRELQSRGAPDGNVQIASGRFSSIPHGSTARRRWWSSRSGARKLTLSDFETDPGPDLRLYVSTGDPADGDLGRFRTSERSRGTSAISNTTCPGTSRSNAIRPSWCGVAPSAWPLRPRRSSAPE
jgi:hypothetical protein